MYTSQFMKLYKGLNFYIYSLLCSIVVISIPFLLGETGETGKVITISLQLLTVVTFFGFLIWTARRLKKDNHKTYLVSSQNEVLLKAIITQESADDVLSELAVYFQIAVDGEARHLSVLHNVELTTGTPEDHMEYHNTQTRYTKKNFWDMHALVKSLELEVRESYKDYLPTDGESKKVDNDTHTGSRQRSSIY